MAEADIVITDGLVVDGLGNEPFEANVVIKDGKIVSVGPDLPKAREEISAKGKIVTPGFLDIHTHYDGQVTWENSTAPSANHGVTSVVMGNCGVGFAPCKPEDRDRLIRLMEGVEDIPEIVMTSGLPWNWETFPEYLDVLERRRGDLDVAAQLPHSCLRVYVMGERASSREAATEADMARMTELTREAMLAGAIGFGTSRTVFHQDRDGFAIPTKEASVKELDAIALGMKQVSRGVLQAVFDSDDMEGNINLFRGVAERSGRPLSFSLMQLIDHPTAWRRGLDLVGQANKEGVDIKAQVIGRPTGLLIGLDLSYNPFSMHPSYRKIAHLSLAEKLAAMKDPDFRRQLLSEQPSDPDFPGLKFLTRFDWMFPLGDPPNYEPSPDTSIAARAARRGVSSHEEAYDQLIANDGRSILFITVANYADGNLAATHSMLKDDNTLLGLGDGGAHYGVVCDAGAPTHMLTYWARDRKGDRFSVQEIVRQLTTAPARAMRLLDRGVIRAGYKADVNIIDFDRLRLKAPEVAYDLPAGARRLVQKADGYDVTMVSGVVTAHNGVPTGALPGRLIRGAQAAPTN